MLYARRQASKDGNTDGIAGAEFELQAVCLSGV